jgi:hypothetical protein
MAMRVSGCQPAPSSDPSAGYWQQRRAHVEFDPQLLQGPHAPAPAAVGDRVIVLRSVEQAFRLG